MTKTTKPTSTNSKSTAANFITAINDGYNFSGPAIVLGAAMYEGKPLTKSWVKAPLATFNRHGLIAGATGTGKTRTLQKIAEGLSNAGCSVLLMDIKGDLSGLAQPGSDNPKIEQRQKDIGTTWHAQAFPVELLSISKEPGVRLRATVSEFGPTLFSRILEINDTQGSIVSLIFKYCDDHQLPLLDLKDFKKVLQYLSNEGKDDIKQEYGAISSASTSTILRKVIELEQQGAELFFGEKSFEVEDLLRKDANNFGYINILRLTDVQNMPKLFSTFMLSLLAEIYEKFPEQGDADKPKLVIFIDEAHLIFDNASKALLDQIETIIKLIRSKGVGIFFCTQSPGDIPNAILGQLGMKVQHSLRAFTAKDRKDIKLAAENFPVSDYYTVDELMTSMGMGEALVTVLNEKGIPSPLVHTLLCSPESSMTTLTVDELNAVMSKSSLTAKYQETIDRDSAYEILNKKLATATAPLGTFPSEAPSQANKPTVLPEVSSPSSSSPSKAPAAKRDKSMIDEISTSPLAKQVGRTLTREITRGIFGVLGVKLRK